MPWTRWTPAEVRKACKHASYNGRICRGCRKYYGSKADGVSVESILAAVALHNRIKDFTYDQLCDWTADGMDGLVDVIVPDFPGGLMDKTDSTRIDMVPLIHQSPRSRRLPYVQRTLFPDD